MKRILSSTARFVGLLWMALFGMTSVFAQTTKNFSFDLFVLSGSYSGNFIPQTAEDVFVGSLSGSVGPLGSAALTLKLNAPYGGNGLTTPAQVSGGLYFNAVDSIAFSYTINDPNFFNTLPYPQFTSGTITGGTGAYAGASGSLDINITAQVTQGSGSVTAGGKTMPLNLTNFYGDFCGGCLHRDYLNGTVSGSTSLGNVNGTLKIETTFHELNSAVTPYGPMVLNFNGSDSITVLMNQNDAPVSFLIVGGTGAYQGASGSLNVSSIHSGNSGYEYKGTGSVTIPGPGQPIITQVKTAYGSTTITINDWIQINGMNLAPQDTPAAGVDWSNAPSFASGMLPTSLGAIDSVTFCGPSTTSGCSNGYIYYYCSAATSPNCTQGDQINVLAPGLGNNLLRVAVSRNGVTSAPFLVRSSVPSPAFPLFDVQGHVVARHLDYSLVGPATLYPGASTPAKAGETIILVAFGLGEPFNPPPPAGSATQTGSIRTVRCWISGLVADTVGAAISPGLAQLNVTIPANVPSGENAITCAGSSPGGSVPFPPGAIITIQ